MLVTEDGYETHHPSSRTTCEVGLGARSRCRCCIQARSSSMYDLGDDLLDGRLGPDLHLRRGDASDADPRQGQGPNRAVGALVRLDTRTSSPTTFVCRRRCPGGVPPDAAMRVSEAEDAPGRVHRPRLPHPARAGRTTRTTGVRLGHRAARGLQESEQAPGADLHAVDQGRRRATTRTIDFDRARSSCVGDRELAEQVRDVSIAVYKRRRRVRGRSAA